MPCGQQIHDTCICLVNNSYTFCERYIMYSVVVKIERGLVIKNIQPSQLWCSIDQHILQFLQFTQFSCSILWLFLLVWHCYPIDKSQWDGASIQWPVFNKLLMYNTGGQSYLAMFHCAFNYHLELIQFATTLLLLTVIGSCFINVLQ